MGRGVSKSGKKAPYGTEFTTVHEVGNIKFVRTNKGATTAPMYTKTAGRIYATIDEEGDVKFIAFYDESEKEEKKRVKQIDLKGRPHLIDGELVIPHVHFGYLHYENGTFRPSEEEQKLIDFIIKEWYDFNSRQ